MLHLVYFSKLERICVWAFRRTSFESLSIPDGVAELLEGCFSQRMSSSCYRWCIFQSSTYWCWGIRWDDSCVLVYSRQSGWTPWEANFWEQESSMTSPRAQLLSHWNNGSKTHASPQLGRLPTPQSRCRTPSQRRVLRFPPWKCIVCRISMHSRQLMANNNKKSLLITPPLSINCVCWRPHKISRVLGRWIIVITTVIYHVAPDWAFGEALSHAGRKATKSRLDDRPW